jgi:isoleucyl-tRNA synthetase
MRYTDIWNDLTEKMGYWVDMDNPYVTYKTKYMESVWWLLKQLWDKELIYKGYTIQPYSPKAGTGLSSHELNMPGTYRDVKDTSVVAQFPAIQNEAFKSAFGDAASEADQVYFLAWTTTPWTLPSNTALTVGKKIDYVLVETFNQYTHQAQKVILAENLVGKYFKEENKDTNFSEYQKNGKNIPWKVLWEGKGEQLLGLKYEQLLPYVLPYENADQAFQVIAGDFVTTEDGTGIVHTAPTFGADDAKVAKDAGVPPMLVLDENENPVPLVDLQGRFTKHVGELAGKYVKNEYYTDGTAPEKSVDVEIAIKLKEENKAFKVEKYQHNYPHCWRTDKPILYYPLDSWFIKVTGKKDRLVELNKTINWKPKATGEGRFGNWLENANDWNLSRSRYWGIPLPIWSTEDGTERKIFGSLEELKTACDEAVEAGLMDSHPLQVFEPGNMAEENYDAVDIHRNIVDEIVLKSASGQPMRRESDLIDVWFDSGAMPYAQLHYPFENKEEFNQSYPADFIAEGVDQTRGWFYTLHAIGTMVFDSVAYKNVVSNGLVLDKNGQKMSKRLGNAADPFETIAKFGADPVRWYMISNAQPWDNLKFDLDGIAEVQRKFFGTLYNTYSFFALYANIDGFQWNADKQTPLQERPELDRWVLSRLQVLKQTVSESYNDYEPTRAARAIQEYVSEELSNWYVRLCRRRFWKGEMSRDKQMAYETLFECLLSVSQLMSPVAPFFGDWLYSNLTSSLGENEKEESVHLTLLSPAQAEWIDETLNERMEMAQRLSSMVFALRKKEKLKVRQPLQKMMVPVLNEANAELVESVKDIVLAEVNVKELEVMRDASGIVVKKAKPDFKKLGPKFGKQMKQVAAVVAQFTQEDIQSFEQKGSFEIEIEGQAATLTVEDIEISTQDIPGWLVTTEGGTTVALDVTLSEELKYEGIARELVNRIQNLRKDSGLEVTDRIALKVKKSELLNAAIEQNEQYITSETLADTLEMVSELNEGLDVDFDNIQTQIALEKM